MDQASTPAAARWSAPCCLLDAELVRRVTGMLAEFEVRPALLRLEVTESAVMTNRRRPPPPCRSCTTSVEMSPIG